MFTVYRKVIISFLLVFICVSFSSSEVLYKMSGKVIYNGIGIEKIEIISQNINNNSQKTSITDKSGEFSMYLPSGMYKLKVRNSSFDSLISSEIQKAIEISKKNVSNIIFFLEKECSISGKVLFKDLSPIEGAIIHARNTRSFSKIKTDDNGNYIIKGLRGDEKTSVMAIIKGAKVEIINNLFLREGENLEDINFTINKSISLTGIVKNKNTGEMMKDYTIIIYDGSNSFPAFVDQNGKFFVYNLTKNVKYQIVVDVMEFKVQMKEIVFLGNQRNVEFEVEQDPDFFEDIKQR